MSDDGYSLWVYDIGEHHHVSYDSKKPKLAYIRRV